MVSQKEIIEELRGECNGCKRDILADRIEADGIAPESSVDALIAEAVAKEREACAELCSGLVKSQVVRSWASHDELEAFDYCANKIRARGQK